MLSKSILAAATCLLSYSAASPTPVQRRDCPTYAVYSALADIASQGVPSATVTALAYPASGIVDNSEYPTSWGIGIDHLQGLIKYYVDTCATTKVVLLGYSQGASVVTGALLWAVSSSPTLVSLLAWNLSTTLVLVLLVPPPIQIPTEPSKIPIPTFKAWSTKAKVPYSVATAKPVISTVRTVDPAESPFTSRKKVPGHRQPLASYRASISRMFLRVHLELFLNSKWLELQYPVHM
nr:hypothetical protein CFP56_72617 [Quercus suber]